MIDIPDDPIISRMMRNGVDSSEPICPVCDQVAAFFFKDFYNEIVGCDNCIKSIDAEEYSAEDRLNW